MIELVDNPISDGLVFLTRDAALEWAAQWKAFNSALTWEVQGGLVRRGVRRAGVRARNARLGTQRAARGISIVA